MPVAIKAVKQRYCPPAELLPILETFRHMVNDCVRIGLEKECFSLKRLSKATYRYLKRYDVYAWYRLMAMTVAVSMLKNYRVAWRQGLNPRKPYARRQMAQLSHYGVKIEDGRLRIPVRSGERVYVPLNTHTLEVLSQRGVALRSVVMATGTIVIVYGKTVEAIEPKGYIALDINLRNITGVTSNGEVMRFDTSDIPLITERTRAKTRRFTRNDHRVRRRLFGKYGLRRRNRIQQRLHRVSKAITEYAKEHQLGIIHEDLTGIREKHRRGNFEDRSLRYRLNSWLSREFQRQTFYKQSWNGLPTSLCHAYGTSKTCSQCGRYDRGLREQRWLICTSCNSILDRDENAARNILARGVRFAPVGPPTEAMVVANPQSRWREVSLHQMNT